MARRFSREMSPRMAFGLVLMCAETEWLRRHARGSRGLWVGLWKQFGQRGDLERLFHSNGQPTSEHRRLLEETAEYHKLLHIFGIEGHQNWYVSLYLQFGFTYQDFKERLPEWLSGWGTLAIQTLQQEAQEASGFGLAWQALRAFRKNNCTRQQAEMFLRQSPWILSGWVEELLDHARKRIELGDRTHTEDWEEDELDSRFLSQPKLVWDEVEYPFFAVEFINLAQQELNEEHYTLWIDQKEAGRLIRQEDGSYRPASDDPIKLDFSKSRRLASLEAPSGINAANQELKFWNSSEEVNLFKLDGTLVEEPGELKDKQTSPEYWVFYPDDLTPFPEPKSICQPTPGYRLSRCGVSDERRLVLRLEGDDYWELQLGNKRDDEWDGGILYVRLEPFLKDNIRQIVIKVREGFSVTQVRRMGKVLDCEVSTPGHFKVPMPFEIAPQECVQGSSLSIRLVSPQGRGRWVLRREAVEVNGNFWIVGEGIIRFDPEKSLNCHDAEHTQFFLRLPGDQQEGKDDRELYWRHCLMEGTHSVRRLRPKAFNIGKLDGYGAPLFVLEGPYNATRRGEPVSCEVNDTGLIRRGKQAEDGCIEIGLTKEIKLEADHAFLGINCEGECTSLSWAQDDPESPWNVRIPNTQLENLAAIILTFRGVRIGSYWNGFTWSGGLKSATDKTAKKWAYLLRHGKAPILARYHKATVRQFAQDFLEEVGPVWEIERAEPLESLPLMPLQDEEAWKRAMTQIWGVRVVRTNSFQADQIICQLCDEEDPCENWTDCLAEVSRRISSPFLYKGILDSWLHEFVTELKGRPGRIAATHKIADNILGEFVSHHQALDACAERLRVHTGFLSAMLAKVGDLRQLNQLEKNNLKVLLNDPRFSAIVSHKLTLAAPWPINN